MLYNIGTLSYGGLLVRFLWKRRIIDFYNSAQKLSVHILTPLIVIYLYINNVLFNTITRDTNIKD